MAKNGAVKKKQKQNQCLTKDFCCHCFKFLILHTKRSIKKQWEAPKRSAISWGSHWALGLDLHWKHGMIIGPCGNNRGYSERGLLSRKRMINWWSFSINYYWVINDKRGLLPMFFVWELEVRIQFGLILISIQVFTNQITTVCSAVRKGQ